MTESHRSKGDILIVGASAPRAALIGAALAAAGGGFTYAFETLGGPVTDDLALEVCAAENVRIVGRAGDTVRFAYEREVDPRPRGKRTHKHWRGGRRRYACELYKGTKHAKRAARQLAKAANHARRMANARKHRMACAHGLARDWYARWERGMPVNFSYQDARDVVRGVGVYPRAMVILIKRLGPAYIWQTQETRGVVQLQGPPAPHLSLTERVAEARAHADVKRLAAAGDPSVTPRRFEGL